MRLPPCSTLANQPAVRCSMTPLPTTVLVASSGFHGTDQDEETENGSQLGDGLDSRRHTVAKGATGKGREHQDRKGSPDEHRLTSTVSERLQRHSLPADPPYLRRINLLRLFSENCYCLVLLKSRIWLLSLVGAAEWQLHERLCHQHAWQSRGWAV